MKDKLRKDTPAQAALKKKIHGEKHEMTSKERDRVRMKKLYPGNKTIRGGDWRKYRFGGKHERGE